MHLRIKESVAVILILLLSTVSSFSQLNRTRIGDVSKKTVVLREHGVNEGGNAKDRFWKTAMERIRKVSELRQPHMDRGQDAPSAASLIVTNLDDSGPGSLRQALIDVPIGETIFFDPTLTGTIQLISGSLVIDKPLTIFGPGARQIEISASSLVSGSVFEFSFPVSMLAISAETANGNSESSRRILTAAPKEKGFIPISIVGLSISGGRGTQQPPPFTENPQGDLVHGGGIFAEAPSGSSFGLEIHQCEIKGNTTNGQGDGGGVYANGLDALIISNSTFSGNLAMDGGGLFIESIGQTVIVNTTFSNNVAFGFGGGIYRTSLNAEVGVAFSTISNNLSYLSGGGIFSESILTATDSIADGTSEDPEIGALRLISTIVANNMTLSPAISLTDRPVDFRAPDLDGVFFSSHSLIGILDGSSGIVSGSFGNIGGNLKSPLDPQLGPLLDNGGPTNTRALASTSPAIDAGNEAYITMNSDQRGALRPWYPTIPTPFPGLGDGSDIGAYEYNFTTAAGASVSGRISDYLGRSISGAQVAVTDTETGVTTTIRTNQFGRYSVEGLTAGRVYVVSVSSKSSKDKPVQILNLAESLGEINFTLSRR